MIVVRKYTLIATLSLSIALLVTGCGENKASQCQRLIAAVKEGTSLIEKNKGQQVTTSLQLSKDLAAVTKSLEEMKLSDPKLQEFQSRFVKAFQNISQAIAKAATALNTAKTAEANPPGRQKIQQARTEINSAFTPAKNAAKESDTLEKDLNQYCTETK